MRLVRLYQADIEGDTVALDERNHHHLVKVLRAKTGQAVELFDGNGRWAKGELSELSTKKCSIIRTHSRGTASNEAPIELELILAVSKSHHFEFALQKAVELGVTQIRPVLSERSEMKLKADRIDKKYQSWLGTIVSACEQSYRCVVPTLHELQPLQVVLNECTADLRFVLDHRSAQPISPSLTGKHFAICVGPEGGLSENDLAIAKGAKFEATSIGPRVLRTETAPLTALAIIGYLYGDLGLS
jgi:16S rRNA (uracil1498-N3)-methyltransferase